MGQLTPARGPWRRGAPVPSSGTPSAAPRRPPARPSVAVLAVGVGHGVVHRRVEGDAGAGRPARAPPWPGCPCSIAREARRALPSSLTSSDSFRWASARSSVSSTGSSLATRSLAARGRLLLLQARDRACGSSRSRPGCAGARAGTRPARAPAAPGGRPPRPARRRSAAAAPVAAPRVAAALAVRRRGRLGHRLGVGSLLGRLGLRAGRLLLGDGLVGEAHCSSTISASTTSSSEPPSAAPVAADPPLGTAAGATPRPTPARRGAG